jgi:hypothetical protein
MLDTWNTFSPEVQSTTLYRIRTSIHKLFAPDIVELLSIRKTGFVNNPVDDVELLAVPLERIPGVEFIEPRDVGFFNEDHITGRIPALPPRNGTSSRSIDMNRDVVVNNHLETVGSDVSVSDEVFDDVNDEDEEGDEDLAV